RICLTQTQRDIVLMIEDKGMGMPAVGAQAWLSPQHKSPITRGVGLASMSERLSQIGGRLEIDSVPGRTTLTAVVPIRVEGKRLLYSARKARKTPTTRRIQRSRPNSVRGA